MNTFQSIVTAFAAIGLASTVAAYVLIKLWPLLNEAWSMLGYKRLRVVFCIAAAGAVMYAGSKHVGGTISFPRTDPEVWYLQDNGSSISNDYLTVAWTRNPVVATTANLYVDGCDVQYTNGTRWIEHGFNVYSNTFSASVNPMVIAYPNATNYDWIVYTDWTPPPVTHTNGVAYVAWQIGSAKPVNNIAIYRTGIYTNGVRVAPNPAITNGPSVSISLTVQGDTNNE